MSTTDGTVCSTLFSPIRVGPVYLENRIVVSPMCQYSALDGNASDWHIVHLGTLALSGAGLVMVEASAVQRDGRITEGCLGLYSDANETALCDAMRRVKAVTETKFGIQLNHAGRKASAHRPWDGGGALTEAEGAWQTVAPSALPFTDGWHTPREMTEQDMEEVLESFVEAAVRAVRIGFDVIELHAGHGYLLHQFLSPLSNRREDEYGGSLENRMRFALRIFEAMRLVCPEGVAVGARITGSDWDERGISPLEAAAFAKRLADLGCAYVDVTSGGLDPKLKIAAKPGYQLPFAAQVRQAIPIPVRTVGLITTPEQAEAIIAEGHADMVALGRAMLADPRWPWRAAHALGAKISWPEQYQRASPASWFG